MSLDSLHTVFTFLSWSDMLGFALASGISILKIFKLLPLTNNTLGTTTIWRDLSKPPERRQGPEFRPV